MNTLNGQNNDHDKELLHTIEQIVQGEGDTLPDPHSPPGVGARLAGTVPQPDAAFAARLEARLVAAAEQRKEVQLMATTNRSFTKQTVPFWNILRLPRFVLRSAVVGLVGLVLVGGWQLNTFTAQARVERMAQRFGLVVIYPEVIEAGVPSIAPEALATNQADPVPSAQVYVPQKLSLEEAQQRTPFPIRLPTWVPQGVEMTALDVGEGGWGCSAPTMEDCAKIKPPVAVHMLYRLPTGAEANIMLDITEITPEGGGGYEVAADALESVTVNDQPAVYTRGGQEMVDGDIENLVWNAAADHHFLSWEENGQMYTLSSYMLGLSRDDMIRIAESLQPVEAAAVPSPTAEPSMSSRAWVPQKLDFEEAQRRTPFPILLPTWLPPGVEMTALDADDGSWACPPQEGCGNMELPAGVVAMYEPSGDTSSGIVLQATKITSQDYGGYVVDPATVQDVTVNGLPAAYVDRSFEEQDAQSNTVRKMDSHMLSWEQNGQIYVLQADKLGLTRDDMIRIAESLR